MLDGVTLRTMEYGVVVFGVSCASLYSDTIEAVCLGPMALLRLADLPVDPGKDGGNAPNITPIGSEGGPAK